MRKMCGKLLLNVYQLFEKARAQRYHFEYPNLKWKKISDNFEIYCQHLDVVVYNLHFFVFSCSYNYMYLLWLKRIKKNLF